MSPQIKAKERCLAMAFICGSDRDRHQELLVGMENGHLKGVNECPSQDHDCCLQPTSQLKTRYSVPHKAHECRNGWSSIHDDEKADATTLATGGERQRPTRAGKDKEN